MTALEPDRDQIEIFIDAIMRHRGSEGFLSLRSFYDDDPEQKKAVRITPVSLAGNFNYLVDCAEDDARRAAQAPRPIVFCPPTCVFNNRDNAREQDVFAGLVLSVECDRNPHEARRQLEELLGPCTVVVCSGGIWIDDDDEAHDKLHLHWRLAQPARSRDELIGLKAVRTSAARLVGGDGTNNPVNHPIRWPGSYHRKATPRLCEIVSANPDIEITLAAAVAALPAPPAEKPQAHTLENWLTFLSDTCEGSQRGSAIARYAGLLMRAARPSKYCNLDPAIVEDSCRLFNELRCKPPLSNDEVHSIVYDVAEKQVAQLKQRGLL
jgi:hypothetical protein